MPIVPTLFTTLVIAASVFAAPSPRAASLSPADFYRTLQSADSAARAKDNARASQLYAQLLAVDSSNVRVVQNSGQLLYRLKRYDEAARTLARAVVLGGGPGQQAANAYDVACCYAQLRQKDEALAWLDRSLRLGLESRGQIAGDEDLASLRGDPRFARLAGPPAAPSSRDDGWRSDLNFLLAEVRRLHAVYRAEPFPAGFDSAAAALRAAIPSLADFEVAMRMQGLLARLGDGHTVLFPVSERVPLHALPLHLHLFPEGLIVFEAPPEYAKLVGRRVVSIGGQPTARLLEDVRPYVSRDNDMGFAWAAPKYLSFCEVLRGLGCQADSSGAEFLTEDAQGRRETVRVRPSSGPLDPHFPKLVSPPGVAEAPLYLRDVANAYWTAPLDDGHVVYLQFNQVENKKDEPLRAFGLRLRKELASDRVTDVIVDVRHNNGGNTNLVRELVRTLVSFDAAHPDAHLFVITGRGTFSAAQVFINRIESLTNGVFVGEPSSSRPDFVGEDTEFRLPYSGLTGTISSRRHFVDGSDTRTWIAPTVPVVLTAADYFAGRDPALEAVLAIIHGRSTPK